MEPRAARELGSHLASDEKLIWAGSPDPLRYALHDSAVSATGAALLAVATLGWMVFVHFVLGRFFEFGLYQYLVLMLAVPLLVIGGGLIAKPMRRYAEARHVAYGLTDRRAVTLIGGDYSRIEDAAPSRFLQPVTHDHANGTQTVLFYREPRALASMRDTKDGSLPQLHGFVAVRNGEALVEQISRITSRPAAAADR